MLYTVLVTDLSDGYENNIVFGNGGKAPFTTTRKEAAEVYAESLKEEFPTATYRVAEIRVI